jgi:hypothetical protein
VFASHFPSGKVQNEAEIRGNTPVFETGPEGPELEDKQAEKKSKAVFPSFSFYTISVVQFFQNLQDRSRPSKPATNQASAFHSNCPANVAHEIVRLINQKYERNKRYGTFRRRISFFFISLSSPVHTHTRAL